MGKIRKICIRATSRLRKTQSGNILALHAYEKLLEIFIDKVLAIIILYHP